jgi:hypothetical protein
MEATPNISLVPSLYALLLDIHSSNIPQPSRRALLRTCARPLTASLYTKSFIVLVVSTRNCFLRFSQTQWSIWLSAVTIGSPAQDAAAKYQAPLLCRSKEGRIPQSYDVFLSPGWTLEQHSAAIDRDLTPYVRWVLDNKILNRVEYHGYDIDDELLATIRSDIYFDMFECSHMVQMPPLDGPQVRIFGSFSPFSRLS